MALSSRTRCPCQAAVRRAARQAAGARGGAGRALLHLPQAIQPDMVLHLVRHVRRLARLAASGRTPASRGGSPRAGHTVGSTGSASASTRSKAAGSSSTSATRARAPPDGPLAGSLARPETRRRRRRRAGTAAARSSGRLSRRPARVCPAPRRSRSRAAPLIHLPCCPATRRGVWGHVLPQRAAPPRYATSLGAGLPPLTCRSALNSLAA